MSVHVPIRPLDLAAIGVYLAAMAAIGVYFARKGKTTEAYFVGNRAFPGWAVGLSMFATSISSVTFLAFPGAAFTLDWRLVVPNLTLPVVTILAIFVFIPFFRRAGVTSAYEYLEERFGPGLRLYGALMFILLQFLRLGMVLFLVAIPVQLLTGLDIAWVILIVGLVVAFYTILGGLEAVIWIDVIQGTVLIVGAISPLFYILTRIPGGLPEVFRIASENHKFGVGPMSLTLAERTFPVMILVGLVNWITEYTTNHNVIQRYLAAASTREARKATLMCGLMSVPIWVFFFFVGTSLFVYFQAFPERAVDELVQVNRDAVFPYFILTKIPAGVAGLVIAGLLAATMSLDSSINSVAAVSVVDIIKRRLCPGRDDAFYLRAGRWMSVVAGAVMIGGAITISRLPKESMLDFGLKFTQIILSGVAGVFLLGFLTTRVNYASAGIGVILTLGLVVYFLLSGAGVLPAAISVNVHTYAIGAVSNVFLLVVGYLLSFVVGGSARPLHGLTVWTLCDRPPAPSLRPEESGVRA